MDKKHFNMHRDPIEQYFAKPKRTDFLGFWKTPIGRKVVYYAAGTTTLALCAGNFLVQTFGLDYYRDFVRSYSTTGPATLPPKVVDRLVQAYDKLQFTEHERNVVEPFVVFGLNTFHAGSTKFRQGCLIGIPTNFGYERATDIERQDMRVREKAIDWDSPSGRLLEQSLLLTEDEQVFALAQELLQVRSYQVLLNSCYSSCTFLGVYSIGSYLNERHNLFARHISLRLVMYSMLGAFGWAVWAFLKDFTQNRYDITTDQKLAALGPRFVRAGVSYYDKQLKRNMALRQLLDDKTYTALGNVNYIMRQKQRPLTARKAFFEEKLRELQQNAANDDIEDTANEAA